MFTLDYRSGEPIYEQLYRSITKMAALGGFDEEEKLPSVRALAQQLGVNPNTVQKAYQQLEHDGVICSVPGKGSFISPDGSALTRQRQIARTGLKGAVHTAKECGMPGGEILEVVKQEIGGVGDD